MRIQTFDKRHKKTYWRSFKRSPNNYGQYEQGVQEILANVKEEKRDRLYLHTRRNLMKQISMQKY